MVSGLFPIDKIDQLEQVGPLRYAMPSYQPMHNVGVVTSQGDVSLGADKVRTNSGFTGTGSKVGILSDSYGAKAGGPAAGVASGDLPNDVEVLEDATGTTLIDEGRAMAEIVHDVAPSAKIAFNTAFLGQASFANGILRLADKGCNIIVDDVYYFAEPFFQDGIIAQAVDQVVGQNVSYFSAAGNSARRSYESAFRNSGQSIIVNGVNYGVAHDFGGGDIRQTITANGQVRLSLQWADPFFSVSGGAGAQTDLNVLVFIGNALVANLSLLNNNLGADPFEFLGLNGAGSFEIAITKVAGPDPVLMKYIEFGNSTISEYNTTGSTVVGHNNAAKTISVGASPWYNTPQFNANITLPIVESFSSLGGTPVFFTTTGVNTGLDPSKIRRNPSVVGPDGGNNTFFGTDTGFDSDLFPNFFGTSAAAPHVAAVAALMQQAGGNRLTPQQVKDLLTSTALDMDDPFTTGFDTGYDFRTGFGFVRAEQAVTAAADPCLNDITLPIARAANIQVALQNGTRTILATEVDNGSTDNCRIASMTVSPSVFTCDNIGDNEVTLTVTDPSGNMSTAKATVTVLGSIPTVPPIQVTPANSTYTGGVATTLYLGYGPQSMTLTASGGGTYSWSSSAGTSPTTGASVVFTATAAGTVTYTVTVTSASGCTATQSVTLTVINVQCSSNGKKMDKVLVCHKGKMLCISATDAANHIEHGDALGACGSSKQALATADNSVLAPAQLEAYPNPFASSTTIRFRTPQAGPVRVQVYNHLGQLVTTLYDGVAAADQLYERTLAVKDLASGLYTCRFTTSTGSVSQRVVLVR